MFFLGVRNVKDLTEMMHAQQVQYDFQYHRVSFDVDIAVVVLSSAKSFLPVMPIYLSTQQFIFIFIFILLFPFFLQFFNCLTEKT